MTNSEAIRAYHERTKHHLHAYARGPEYLDWEQQPNPYRRYEGAPLVPLSLGPDPDPPQGIAPFDLASISKLLELSFGLSAWKVFGPDRWALRCNPSSGNLHPTEAYLLAQGLEGLTNGVYHYAVHEHALEQRAAMPSTDSAYCVLGLSSLLWREAWKYGERAFRYTQLDTGHALAAVRYAAAVLGWRCRLLPAGDVQISRLLGLDDTGDDAEVEQSECLVQLLPEGHAPLQALPLGKTGSADWQGKANALGGDPYLHWPVAEQAHVQSHCDGLDLPQPEQPALHVHESPWSLTQVIRQRRSAQAFVPKQSELTLENFTQILQALLVDADNLPWDFWALPIRVHPVLFVHRVQGLEPGVYALPRSESGRSLLSEQLNQEFAWQTVEACAELPLYRLAVGDVRKLARALSCHQEIASASSFSLSMLAEFDNALAASPCNYRHLHWEAGLLGQVLYLQAEAVGMRGTGIGCFFDDGVHEALGLSGTQLQAVYHFTVGYPREDGRLQTLPPYQHLNSD